MQRLTAGIISLILVGAAFIYLWITNPLYAFIGGIVFVVFMIVGYALVKTLSQKNTSSVEPSQHVLPRRTGEFKRIEDIERPEGSWEDLNTPVPPTLEPLDETIVFSDNDKKKKEEAKLTVSQPSLVISPPAPLQVPSPEPEPQPSHDRNRSESFGGITPEESEKGIPTSEIDGLLEEAEIGAVTSEIDDLLEEPEIEELAESFEENDEWLEEITGDVTNSRLLQGVKDFDHVAENIKEQINAGTLGDSPEDLDDFFQSALDKAAERDDVDDYIDGETVDDYVDHLVKGETEDWLHEEAQTKKDRKLSTAEIMIENLNLDEAIEEIDLGIEWEESYVETPSTNTADFDLMSLVTSLEPEKQQEFFSKMSEIPIGNQTEAQLIELYEDLAGIATTKDLSPSKSPNLSEVQFTSYYPRQASAGTNYGFYVYAHLPDALVASDIQQFEADLGGRVPKAKVSAQTAKIEEGANIAVIIQCDQLKFNQLGSIQAWREPFVRFDFDFIAHKALVDEVVEGRIAILLGMIEIASIDFQITITPANPLAAVTAQPKEPLTALGYDPSTTANIYQKIFISYSHKDSAIAEQYRKIQMMLGNTLFMDTHSIRSGEQWEVALKQFIDDADVFQLFWSKNSAISDHVRFEWDYALSQRCPDSRCDKFIRPTYWEKPLPDIPLELGHLHFAFVELEQ